MNTRPTIEECCARGMTAKQAAAAMGISQSAVRSRAERRCLDLAFERNSTAVKCSDWEFRRRYMTLDKLDVVAMELGYSSSSPVSQRAKRLGLPPRTRTSGRMSTDEQIAWQKAVRDFWESRA